MQLKFPRNVGWFVLGFVALLVIAADVTTTMFDTTYFSAIDTSVSLKGSLTNWAKLNTNQVNGGSATNLTPWASDINGAGFSLTNAGDIKSGSTNLWPALAGKQASGSYITALTGDVTASGPGSSAASLKSTGTAGTYRSVTFDAQGRETSGSNPTTFAGYSLSDTSANLAAALTDETGTGVAVFGTAPTISSPVMSAVTNSDATISRVLMSDATKKQISVGAVGALKHDGTQAAASDLSNGTSGSGAIVLSNSPTIFTPTIASFANATHNHQAAAGGGTLAEAALALTDVTTANVSTSAHGFAPKGDNNASHFLNGQGIQVGAVTTINTNGVQLATGVTIINVTNATVAPTVSGSTVTLDLTASGGGGGSVANPTATIVNNSAINGSASSAIRSDGAPAISTTGVFQFGRLGLGAAADATIPLVIERDALGTTPSGGLVLTNTTAAAVGAQQVSPSILWQGNGWGTTGGASQPVAFRASVLPVQGTTPTAKWTLESSINGGAFVNAMTYDTFGGLTTASSISSGGNLIAGSGSDIKWGTSNSRMTAPADGTITLKNSSGTGFTALRIGPDAAAPSNVEIRPGDGSGTDKPGGNQTISGGIATGTGRGGDIIEKTSLTTTTGSTAQSQSTRKYTSAEFVNLTESSATLFANIAVASSKYAGATLTCTVNANDGTDFQCLTSQVRVDAINKGGTVTATLTQTDNTTAASSGTLTATYTAVANGNGVDLKCNAVSSLTQTVLRVKWSISNLNSDDTATVTPQ